MYPKYQCPFLSPYLLYCNIIWHVVLYRPIYVHIHEVHEVYSFV